MTQDLHPHWKSTNGTPENVPLLWPIAEEQSAHSGGRIPVMREHGSRGTSVSLLIAVLSFAALSLLFFYGINRIRGDLLAEMRVPRMLTITDSGMDPVELTIEAGNVFALTNQSSSAQQLQTDQRKPDGSPLLLTPLIPRGDTVEVTVPADAAGMLLMLRSTILPTLAVSLSVAARENSEEVPSGERAPSALEEGSRETETALEEFNPPIPVLPAPHAVMNRAPSAPAPVPSPSLSIPATASAPPTITIGGIHVPSPSSAFPSILRSNRFTVGSLYTSPVHAMQRAEEAVRGALHPAAPREQPATGPALWISVVLTLGAMPMIFRKRRKA